MFIEKIIKKDEKITITVRVEKVRKFSFEKKEVYRKNVEDLIPEEISAGARLISGPDKLISNQIGNNFVQSGEWVFELKKEKPKKVAPKPAPKQVRKTAPRSRRKPAAKKS